MQIEHSKYFHFMDLLKVKLVDKLRKADRQYDYTVFLRTLIERTTIIAFLSLLIFIGVIV